MQRGDGAEADEIEFGRKFLGVLLFLGLLALFHRPAEPAGMLAVEGHFQRFRERRVPREADGHANPRDGLQNSPVPAHCENEHQSNAELGDSANHCVRTVGANHSPGKGISRGAGWPLVLSRITRARGDGTWLQLDVLTSARGKSGCLLKRKWLAGSTGSRRGTSWPGTSKSLPG